MATMKRAMPAVWGGRVVLVFRADITVDGTAIYWEYGWGSLKSLRGLTECSPEQMQEARKMAEELRHRYTVTIDPFKKEAQ